MGRVSLAEDRDIGRWVAIKRTLSGGDDERSLAYFAEEIRTLGSLEHPNIVPIHDVGVDDRGRLFFVMKFVDGESLSDVIERLAAGDPQTHAEYPFDRRLDVFVGVLRALAYAHAQGIVHRDVKPANILICRFGQVFLTDWGIARRSGQATEARGAGTPAYMSPEQAAGVPDAVVGGSDLYGAFATLFELLTLRTYVGTATSLADLLDRVQRRPCPPPMQAKSYTHAAQLAVPIELRHFVCAGLAKDPCARIATANEALLELEGIRAGRIRALCGATRIKRLGFELSRLIDARPLSTTLGLSAAVAALLLWFATTVVLATAVA